MLWQFLTNTRAHTLILITEVSTVPYTHWAPLQYGKNPSKPFECIIQPPPTSIHYFTLVLLLHVTESSPRKTTEHFKYILTSSLVVCNPNTTWILFLEGITGRILLFKNILRCLCAPASLLSQRSSCSASDAGWNIILLLLSGLRPFSWWSTVLAFRKDIIEGL